MKQYNIFQAIRENDIEAVRSFLPDQLEATDEEGNTTLHEACGAERFEIAELLVSSGADPFTKNIYGNSALDICPMDYFLDDVPHRQVLVQLRAEYLKKSWGEPLTSPIFESSPITQNRAIKEELKMQKEEAINIMTSYEDGSTAGTMPARILDESLHWYRQEVTPAPDNADILVCARVGDRFTRPVGGRLSDIKEVLFDIQFNYWRYARRPSTDADVWIADKNDVPNITA